jgi:hypothetical protein
VEDFMRSGIARFSITAVLCLAIAATASLCAWAKAPEGFRDIKLGMTKKQVLDALQKSPAHVAYDDNGTEIGEIIRNDDLFRYATYKFDHEGVLVEIGLQMREIVGREKCVEQFGARHGVQISPLHSTVEADISIEVHDNSLVIRKATGKDTHAAVKGSTS